jgi:N utilization substance protein B
MKLNSNFFTRLVAVQSVYALMMHPQNNSLQLLASQLLKSYQNNELFENSNLNFCDLNMEYFYKLIEEYDKSELDYIKIIGDHLQKKWTIDNMDTLLLTIIKLATFELFCMGDNSALSIINDYVRITKEFYDEKEVGFVNAILDGIAHKARPDEFKIG